MASNNQLDNSLRQAADAIRSAEALLIGAGAGMGVDSGLPDFRGDEGFWKAYPPFRGKSFADLSTPHWFHSDPSLAWGFFGHRLNLYSGKAPHDGFQILRRWSESIPLGSFVFTSNVDGHFQKAGFSAERVFECHGSIHHLQCANGCAGVWSSPGLQMEVDEVTIRAKGGFPVCPRCRGIARPNILMFGDNGFLSSRCSEQRGNYDAWLRNVGKKYTVAIEMGAGLAIPSVRRECERRAHTLIRINPREPEIMSRTGISLPLGALTVLRRIDSLLGA